VLKSGVHATLAGVVMAFFIPMRDVDNHGRSVSPVKRIENDLHSAVAFGILPLFAFANAGVSLSGLTFSSLLQPVPLGIALGLFLGKQIGVFGFSWLAIKLRFARLPKGASWLQIYGVALLCGIGFTMSLFIASLAFEHGGPDYAVDDRLGIITGTLLSAFAGYFILRFASRRSSDRAGTQT
jgi:NhaA family Na+:H+ antiporter